MQIRFKLDAELELSSEFPQNLASTIENAVREANEIHFKKGVPKSINDVEIGKITYWETKENVLFLQIVSGPYTRAHDALFRFRKQIASVLGKFHIGVRALEIKQYTIEFGEEIDDGLIPRLPFVQTVHHGEGRVEINLKVHGIDLENRIPDRLVRLIEEKIQAQKYGGKGEHWDLVFQSASKKRQYVEDPTKEMITRYWIKHGISRGQWILGPQVVQLFRAFEDIVEQKIIRPLGFSEMMFPKLVPWEIWMKSGHAKGIYPEIYYVCTPKTRDSSYWEDVADYFKITGEIWTEKIRERIDGPIGGLCYAQCPSFWPFLQGETLANDCLPIKVFDRSGTSHRYESGGIHGIERVDEFHRIEIVWLGSIEQTIEIAEQLHKAFHHVFEDILELEWRAAKVTPWFMAQEGMVGECGCETIGTTDYEAFMPYNNDWLEFQNVSVNGDKYPKGFNVKMQSGAECWSGCSGIGLERWTASFLAQKGFDPSMWPEAIVNRVGKMNDVFRFL